MGGTYGRSKCRWLYNIKWVLRKYDGRAWTAVMCL